MSTSIYSFIQVKEISNSDLKEYYDHIQVIEDKLHSKLTKTQYKSLRKVASKETLTDAEILRELKLKLKELKKVVLQLDTKITTSLGYQESILAQVNISFLKTVNETILKERIEYEKYIKKYLPVDIRTFTRFDEEYRKLYYAKLPFEEINRNSELFNRINNYITNYDNILYELRNFEQKYKTIYTNAFYYDNYKIKFEENSYYSYKGKNYGKMGENYYRDNELITEENYQNNKKQLNQELQEIGGENLSQIDQNNYSLLNIQYCFTDEKKTILGKKGKYENWYILLEKSGISLYNDNTLVSMQKENFHKYVLNESCKGPIILEVEDSRELIAIFEGGYNIFIQFNVITGIKEIKEGIIKKKTNLKLLQLDRKHNLERIEEIKKTPVKEVDYQLIMELEKLKDGLHYISIKNNELNVYKSEEKKRYKVEVTNCPDLEELLLNKQKFNVEFKNNQKIYLGITKEMLLLTDKTNYQIIHILQEEKEENKNESED